MKKLMVVSLLSVMVLAVMPAAWAQEATSVAGFPDLERRAVTFWSDGTMLAGDLTYPKGAKAGDNLPCIVLCHGWGGVKAHLNFQIAPRFAKEGYAVLAFDYRGWGESNSRLVMMDKMPKIDADGNVTVTAVAVREIVDPLDQQEDIDAAITFVEGEPMVDANRIGIWGSSYGGGHVVWRAANDDRVKCVVAQVGAMDQRGSVIGTESEAGGEKALHASKIARVRGESAPVPFDAVVPEGLRGAPYYERFLEFSPVDAADQITVPVMIVDAELEHYFDNKDNGFRVSQILKENNVPVEYHEIEGMKHYDVYTGKGLDTAMKLEIPWFNKHLKGAK